MLPIYFFLIILHPVWCFYQSDSNVTSLTTENFDKISNSDSIWIVQFYSYKSKECRDFEKEYTMSANVLKNIVRFGAVNIDNNTKLVKRYQVDVKKLPMLKIFGISDEDQFINYNGVKTARDLVDSILASILDKIKTQFGEILPENLIKEVNDKNFDQTIMNSAEPWLVQFYAPWCVHCKAFKPIWEQAALYLKRKVNLASIDATVNKIKAREYEIQAYPTVKLFPPGQKTPKTILNYVHERSVTEIVNWVQEALPGPDVIQITDVEVFQDACMAKKLCIIGFLPYILDCKTRCRENYLEMLKQLGEKYKKHDWGWMWSEGGAQNDLEEVFDVGGFGYPALVVLNPTKNKYTVFKGAFTKNNINDFLILLAKANAVNINEDIASKIVEVESWDHKDIIEVLLEELDDVDIAKDEL